MFPPFLPNAARTSEAVRLTLLVSASTITIEPFGPNPSYRSSSKLSSDPPFAFSIARSTIAFGTLYVFARSKTIFNALLDSGSGSPCFAATYISRPNLA